MDLIELGDFENAIAKFNSAISIEDEINRSQTQSLARCGLAQTHLFQNDLVNARATIEAVIQYDVPEHNHDPSTLHGIIALRQGDEILFKTAEFYSALDAQGLALCGLAICDLRLTIGRATR